MVGVSWLGLCPNIVPKSPLRASCLVNFFFISVKCGLNDIDELYITPNILGVCVRGIGVLFMVWVGVAVSNCPVCEMGGFGLGGCYFESGC